MKEETKLKLFLWTSVPLMLVMTCLISYIGYLKREPFQTWFLPVVLSVALLIYLVRKLRDFISDFLWRRHQKLVATGVYAFYDSVSGVSDFSRLLLSRAESEQAVLIQRRKWKQLFAESDAERTLTGIVCGEELIAIVQKGRITVTVTQEDTAKAFRRLPRYMRKNVHVVRV